MRHRKKGRKLNRSGGARRALFKNLLTSFFLEEKLTTTLAKAKSIQGKIDSLINRAKKNNLVDRRFIYAYLNKKESARHLIEEIAPRFAKRDSGCTRILKMGRRRGDQALMARLVLVEKIEKQLTSKKSNKKPKESKKLKKNEK